MLTDQQLLCEYAEHRSEEAFSELVRRYIGLVYSAALRMVRDAHLAQDVAQAVFLALAQNAGELTNRAVLSGWLHRAAQNLAAKAVRSDVRRRAREQQAATMNELLSAEPDPDWEQIGPHLDAALGELNEADRDALLLRYFDRKSAREMAQRLGISDEAAQKRVTRAVERLREVLLRQGVTASATALVAAISTNAIQAVPVGLTDSIAAAAGLAAQALQPTTAIATAKTIAMTTLQKAIIGTTLVAAVATGVYKTYQASQFRAELKTVQLEHGPLIDQVGELTRERDTANAQLAALRDENARLNSNSTEVAKLRGETSRLRERARELEQSKTSTAATEPALERTMKSWAARATLLRQRFEQAPEQKIPELSLLGEKEWLDAVKNVERLETDAEYRQAAANLRSSAKQAFGEQTRKALKKYADANDGMLPGDLTQLVPYYEKPVDEAALSRYSLLQTGKLSEAKSNNDDFLFAEVAAAVDADYDSHYKFRMNGTRSSGVAGMLLEQAAVQYAAANQGLLPTDASQLTPYLKQPVDLTKVRKMLADIPPNITTLEQLKAAGYLK